MEAVHAKKDVIERRSKWSCLLLLVMDVSMPEAKKKIFFMIIQCHTSFNDNRLEE